MPKCPPYLASSGRPPSFSRAVTVRVRKLAVPMDVSMDYAEVELRRER